MEVFRTVPKSYWHEEFDFRKMCDSDDDDIKLVKAALSMNGKYFLKRFVRHHHCYIDLTLPSGTKFENPPKHSARYRERKKWHSTARHHARKYDNSKSMMDFKDKKHAFPHKPWRGLEERRFQRADSVPDLSQMGLHQYAAKPKSAEENSDGIRREIKIGQISVVVKLGDIVNEQACALMNIVPPLRDLSKGSAISESFVNAGGPELVQMYQDNVQSEEDGFVVTQSAGNLKCDIILHVVLRTRVNDTEREVRKVMRTCYKFCQMYGVTTLALPPLGCGHLHGYNPDSVVKAMLDETSKLAFGAYGQMKKVTIVVYDWDVCQKFLKKLSCLEAQSTQCPSEYLPDDQRTNHYQDDDDDDDSDDDDDDDSDDDDDDDDDSDDDDNDSDDDDGSDDGRMALSHSESSPAMSCFRSQPQHERKLAPWNAVQVGVANVSTVTVKIIAKDKQTCLDCVKKLAKEMKENYLYESKPVSKIHKLPPAEKNKIRDILAEHNASVKQRRVNRDAYILKGWKRKVRAAHAAILKVLSDFWLLKAYEESVTPEYWSMGRNIIKDFISKFLGALSGKKSKLENVENATFQEIVKLVDDTWQSDLVGKGNDAVNLRHTQIKVLKVKRVENLDLYELYFKKRQEIFKSLWRSKQERFPQLEKVKGCREGHIKTSRVGKCLTRDVYPEINEYYFFHGTKTDKIGVICENGLDCRLSSNKSMLGTGVYGAESSTKADQYTDSKKARTPCKKKMFLMRMVLGNMFVCTDPNPHKYRKEPCRTCYRDDCTMHTMGSFDSVVGDMGKLFREFVVYDKNQCYPEYIITYRRN
ncbi:hypothetical protein CHS0354_002931 [Potamilus streckersoni]|uniref:Poly [ADP-ribose] polymerase n=1 Tax=Potamilus streckersoni TaxID=2493646 RepID=A0AAE0RQ78_9BIVA|nr:hypothetical protein CHS0354_002931 [Potamilus streckersoni]